MTTTPFQTQQISGVPSGHPLAESFYKVTMPIINCIIEMNPNYKVTAGDAIFAFVSKLIGPDGAPKVTGMLIGLPVAEIQKFFCNFDLFS